MCEKIAYSSAFEAKKVISKANSAYDFKTMDGKRRKHRRTYKPKRFYKCPECGKFHLTSHKKIKKQRR